MDSWRIKLNKSVADANDSDFSDDELWNSFTRKAQWKPAKRGSKPGRSPNLRRDRAEAHKRIVKDYFANPSLYSDEILRRRFRMRYFTIETYNYYDTDDHCFCGWWMVYAKPTNTLTNALMPLGCPGSHQYKNVLQQCEWYATECPLILWTSI